MAMLTQTNFVFCCILEMFCQMCFNFNFWKGWLFDFVNKKAFSFLISGLELSHDLTIEFNNFQKFFVMAH